MVLIDCGIRLWGVPRLFAAAVALAIGANGGGGMEVKLIANDVETSDTAIDRFYREARTMARLSHPNVIRLRDIPATSESYSVQTRNTSIVATKADHGHVIDDYGIRDSRPQCVSFWVEAPAAPNNRTIGRIMHR